MSEDKKQLKGKKNLNWKIELLKAKIGKNPKVSKAKLIAKIPDKVTSNGVRPKYYEMEDELAQLETEQKCFLLTKQIKLLQSEIKKAQLATCKSNHQKINLLENEDKEDDQKSLTNEITLIKGIKLDLLSKKILSRVIHKLDLLKDHSYLETFHLSNFEDYSIFNPSISDNQDKVTLDKIEKKILSFKALSNKINQVKSEVFKIVTNKPLQAQKKQKHKSKQPSEAKVQPTESVAPQESDAVDNAAEAQESEISKKPVETQESNIDEIPTETIEQPVKDIENNEEKKDKKRKASETKKSTEAPKAKQAKKSKDAESIFVESLNDDETDDKAFKELYGIKPKNRPGQRARRQKFEKLYGEQANHVKQQQQLEADEKKRKERLRKQHLLSKGKNPDKVSKPAKSEEKQPENLHPSWVAKQQQKALMANAFKSENSSKKITFDD
ncbi:hypothetical protein CONCODRAFT_68943 [Conidiobolus coronatus NRRL 28638]|uniref:Bud22 domain-containing protein n=1 Tax=Conidiobolus coronatus (strain ATCC 28846 / CBS 209.66 / NRRL 28638) TaxID=796925 RepID=A0A137PC02_CONC2|nr:hypothetical protein CONCODRAFT_68943 [Conidiobolus coronatus NRRL 28638]|eukprot:KXN72537.1 hypothetical protein CONCODRAFT_68943 [Conidiobolus coronatus NRRL 28638]